MSTINLDRAYKLDIIYPLGVKETVTLTNNSVTELTDTYEIVIATQGGQEFETISEDDSVFIKSENTLTWNINYEHDSDLKTRNYIYELRNLTQDWIEFKGVFKVTKTLE